MSENEHRREALEERSRCQIAHALGKPPSLSCAEPPKEKVDGLLLCEGHALMVKLEGQIECWEEMLFHIEIWSREARRRQRPDVVRLLQDQRVRATAAIERAYEDLDLAGSETPKQEVLSGGSGALSRMTRRGSLPLLPRGARQLFLGLRGHRRR